MLFVKRKQLLSPFTTPSSWFYATMYNVCIIYMYVHCTHVSFFDKSFSEHKSGKRILCRYVGTSVSQNLRI